jgi:hypothetical protein
MTRTISSSQTFLVKFVFPLLWCSIFGAVTIAIGTGFLRGSGIQSFPAAMVGVSIGVWVLGAGAWWQWGAQWKKVRLDDGALCISNFRQEIRVPLADIEEVTQNRVIRGQPVTIRFRRATEFGDSITFMPKVRAFGFWRLHPIVTELRELAQKARA